MHLVHASVRNIYNYESINGNSSIPYVQSNCQSLNKEKHRWKMNKTNNMRSKRTKKENYVRQWW